VSNLNDSTRGFGLGFFFDFAVFLVGKGGSFTVVAWPAASVSVKLPLPTTPVVVAPCVWP
jgi:hypothetical protein